MRLLLVGTAAVLVVLMAVSGAMTASAPSRPATVEKRRGDFENACPSRVVSGGTTWFSLAPEVGDYAFECRYGLPSEDITRVRISIFWVPPEVAPGRVVSGDCRGGKDRPQGSGGWLSGDQYLSVISLAGFDDRENVLKKLLGTLEGKGFALRCDYADTTGGAKTGGKTTTRSAAMPKPGGSTPRRGFPVNATSTSATVVVSGPSVEDLVFTGISVIEKARQTSLTRLEKLEGIKRKVEANCLEGFFADRPDSAYGFGPALRGQIGLELQSQLLVACERLLATVQTRIDAIAKARGEKPSAEDGTACQVHSVGLVSTQKGGKWTTKAVAKGVAPQMKASCKATSEAFRLDLRATGKRTLREAVGPKLQLRLRRSESAAPRTRGDRITVRLTQR